MPGKVTQNDLNALFPWHEGCSKEPVNKAVLFICPASVTFVVMVPAN